MLPSLCQLAYFNFGISNPINANPAASEAFQSRQPSPSSIMLMEHFSQIHQSGRFQDFDYGYQQNMVRYASDTPPEFDLTQITGVPIAIFEQEYDFEAAEGDNEWLMQQINEIVVFNRTYRNYGHYDLYLAENTTVYLEDVVDLLQQFNQG